MPPYKWKQVQTKAEKNWERALNITAINSYYTSEV